MNENKANYEYTNLEKFSKEIQRNIMGEIESNENISKDLNINSKLVASISGVKELEEKSEDMWKFTRTVTYSLPQSQCFIVKCTKFFETEAQMKEYKHSYVEYHSG